MGLNGRVYQCTRTHPSSMSFCAVCQLKRTSAGKPNTGSWLLTSHFLVPGSVGIPRGGTRTVQYKS